jgi:type VI secretion system protein VasI
MRTFQPRVNVKVALAAAVVSFATVGAANAQEKCKSIADDDARLSCYDIENGVTITETPVIQDGGKWRVSTEISPMTDQKTVFMILDSDNDITGGYAAPGPATLILRCAEGETNAFILLNDQFLSDTQNYGWVDFRLDDDEMDSIGMRASDNNKALGLWGSSSAILFIKGMLGHEKLTVRATPHNSNAVVAVFDIRGIDQVIGELRETCGW